MSRVFAKVNSAALTSEAWRGGETQGKEAIHGMIAIIQVGGVGE